jgi:hypothetical protein
MGVPPMRDASGVKKSGFTSDSSTFDVARTGETPVSQEKFSISVRTLHAGCADWSAQLRPLLREKPENYPENGVC